MDKRDMKREEAGQTDAGHPYRKLYEEGTRFLTDAGLEEREAKLDARALLEYTCGTSLRTLLSEPDLPVSAEAAARFRERIGRRGAREPLSYITGTRDFMGLTFKVDRSVLIPEQDTENLVEEIMRNLCGGERILDLCTGSGCILLSLLYYSNGTTGVGTDLSHEALGTAADNAGRLNLAERAKWRQGDLFEAVGDDERFDLIVSNPPYIRSDVIDGLSPEVSVHEPRLALDGGEDGLSFYRKIIPEAVRHLVTGGILFLEIGFDQAEAVSALMRDAGYYEVRVIRDYGGNDRIVHGIKSINQSR